MPRWPNQKVKDPLDLAIPSPVTVSEVIKLDPGVKRSKLRGHVLIDVATKYMPAEKWPNGSNMVSIAIPDILWKRDRVIPGLSRGWRACVPKHLKPGTGRPAKIPKPGKVICREVTSNGDPCRQYAVRGGNLCPKHGGALPNYRAMAMERLERNAPKAVKTVIEIMNEGEDGRTRLAAARDVLDRTGVNSPKEMKLEISKFEEIVSAGGVLIDLAEGE